MKYIKFLLKCILAVSPAIILIGYTLLCPFAYMDEEYPAWRYSKEVSLGEMGEEYYNTVILGDSGSMSSFVPSELSDSTVNMAVGGGTSIEMYYFLEDYLDNHEAPENVVMMFMPFHYWNIDNYSTRTMYFRTLSIKRAVEVANMAKEHNSEGIDYENAFYDELACRLGLPTKYLPAINASKLFGRYNTNKSLYEELISNKGYGEFGKLDGCDDISYETSYSAIAPNGDIFVLLNYYQKIYELCANNGIKILLVQPAVNEASYEKLNPEYISMYEAYIEAFTEKWTNAVCEKTLRKYPNEYFGDATHLNSKGAKIFSAEIKNLYPEYFK